VRIPIGDGVLEKVSIDVEDADEIKFTTVPRRVSLHPAQAVRKPAKIPQESPSKEIDTKTPPSIAPKAPQFN
jgi:hypothetical protein